MNFKNRLFVSCEEANLFCDKNQYKEASFWEKVRLNIHFAYCKVCRQYSINNGKLTQLIQNLKVSQINDDKKLA